MNTERFDDGIGNAQAGSPKAMDETGEQLNCGKEADGCETADVSGAVDFVNDGCQTRGAEEQACEPAANSDIASRQLDDLDTMCEASSDADQEHNTCGCQNPRDIQINNDNNNATYKSSKQAKIKNKRSVSFGALIACMMAIALFAGGIGAGLTYYITQGDSQNQGQQMSATNTPSPSGNMNLNYSNDNVIYNDLTKLADDCIKSVVGIETESGSGSGVIITEDGYIVTNYHVISGYKNVAVYTQDGTKYDATLIGSDSQTDLAVLKIEATGLTAATLGNSVNINIGETVLAIGNPLGTLMSTVTNGIISGVNREVTIDGHTMNLIQTNAAINPGNSGGGLFNTNGELIGVVNAKSMGIEVEGLGFAIPIDTAKSVINDLISQGYVSGRPYLGVSLQDIVISYGGRQDPYNFFFGQAQQYENRVQVMSVEEGGAAAAAGMQVNDIILSIEGTEITSKEDINSLLMEYNAGDTVIITVQRGNDKVDLPVTLGERTSSN